MAICDHLAPNGEKSTLYQNLEKEFGADKAHDMWSAIRTEQFKNKHPWENLVNSEPTSDWVKSKLLQPRNPKLFENHSGGALGSDIAWQRAGESFGVTNHIHYYHVRDRFDTKPPMGNKELSDEEVREGWKHVLIANKSLKRKVDKDFDKNSFSPLLARNWYQVRNSDVVFAISKLTSPTKVAGGTGWAVQMAIDSKKPVHVFDQVTKDWYKYDYDKKQFVPTTTPTLTQKFAGIGTRELTKVGVEAINDVYKKTFGKDNNLSSTSDNPPPKPTPSPDRQIVNKNLESGTDIKGVTNRNSEEVMLNKVKAIYSEAIANPDKDYNIDYEFKSDKFRYPSGYTAKELANLFDTGEIPSNIHFTDSIQKLINNSSKRILESIKSNIPTDVINRNEELVTKEVGQILLPKRDSEGNLTGYFSSAEQQAIIDSTMYAINNQLLKDPSFGANAIVKVFKMYEAKALRGDGDNFTQINNNRLRIADELLDQMGTLGYKIDPGSRRKILNAVTNLKDLSGVDTKGIEEDKPHYEIDELNSENTEFMQSVGHGLKDWGEVSFEHDPKDTASAHLKMFIAMQPEMDRGIYKPKDTEGSIRLEKPASNLQKWANDNPREFKSLANKVNRKDFWMEDEKTSNDLQQLLHSIHPILPQKNFLGFNKLVDFESTFQDILSTLADSPIHDFETYMNTLSATGRPNLLNLVDSLNSADEQVKNEFARLVSMQYTNFTMMLFNRTEDEDGKSYSLKPMISNKYSQLTTIVKNWREQQKLAEITKINESGQRVVDVERAKKWVDNLSLLQKLDWSNDKSLERGKRYMQDIFKISGISLSDEMMDNLFNKMEKLTKGTTLSGGIGKQFSVTQDGQPNGMFSAFIMKMAGLSGEQDINDVTDNKLELENRAEINNPLYTESTTMNILSKVAAEYTPVLHSGTSKSTEGKDIWDYSMHTKLSHQIIDMKENYDEFREKYSQVDIAKDNILLDTLDRVPQYRDKIKLTYMDGMKPTWGKKGTTRGDMSDREHLLMSMALFQNQGNGYNKIPKVHYISLTHSDKTTTPVFMNMPKYDFGNYDSIPKDRIGKIGSTFYNIFKSEYSRIIKQDGIDFNDARYNKGKRLFYFMPEFNKESMQDMVEKGSLTDKEFKTIWNGDKLTRSIRDDIELPVINKILNKIATDRIDNTIEEWTKQGLVTEDSHTFDKEYVRKLLDKNGIKSENKNKYRVSREKATFITKEGKQLTDQEIHDITVRNAAKDYSLNYFVHNVGMSQLFYGDPAMTFKTGKTDMESVDLTLKEYGKRLAKDIAPGLDPYFKPEDQKFNSLTLADHIQNEKYLDNLGKIYPSYKKVNATDAQELTTVPEHLKVMYANGQIPSKTYNEMMNIISKSKDDYYEFTIPEHINIIMNPHKPVYSGQRPVQDGAILEDYIKTSSIPLYPPATKGLEIDNLRKYMENNNISRAPYESGKKIGTPNKPVQFFDENGTFKMPNEEDIRNATQQLDRSNFRIQQEVPYDETKDHIGIVSQMNKLIVDGINDLKGFKIDSKDGSFSGAEVRTMKEDIRKAMIGLQYDKFLRDWGIDTGKIMDKDVIYDKLIQLAKNNNNFTKNEILSLTTRDKNNNLFIPLQYNTGVDKFESMLMSIVKDIAQVQMPGKSYVQASSAGWNVKHFEDIGKTDIIWTTNYDGSSLKTTRVENGKVKPAQILLPFSFLNKEGNTVDINKYIVDGKIDTTKIPSELLKLIGARIPNQGHSSMAAMEVVGFLPKNMGDTIIVPAAFTKQMGADFDVDKLYTYRQPYYHNAESDTFRTDNTPNSMEKHQSDYFNLHWSILTHPDMAERVLKPLDKPDLKDENEVLKEGKKDGYNYYDHISQLQDFQKGKDAKLLVALTSLSVTFNSIIQDKSLHYVKDVITTDEYGNTIRSQMRDYIKMKDEHSGKTLDLTNLSGDGKSNYTKEDGGDITSDSIRTKSDNHSTIQSAAVDNAKDRALDNLNITPDTFKAIDALLQLETQDGKALNLKYATRLLTQPIIKEFADEMRKGNDSLSESFDRNLKNTTFANLRVKYLDKIDKNLQEKIDDVVFDPQLLKKAQGFKEDSEDYIIHQVAALDLFRKLDDIGQRKSELQSLFNQDTKGAGPNILTALDKGDKLTKLEQTPIADSSEIFSNDNRITEAGFTAQATTGVATNILTQLLPYDKYAPIFKELIVHSGKSSMSINDQRNVLRSVRSFTYNSGEHWWKDATSERGRLFYTQEDQLSLARRTEEAKRTWGKDNYFLQRLDPVIGNTTTSPDFLEYQAATVGRIDEQNNNRAWLEMLMSDKEDQRRLGEDLLRYAYLTGGVQDQNSFVKFVPNAYIANTDFGNMLKEKGESYQGEQTDANNPTLDMPGFIPQFIQHNPEKAFNITRDIFGDIPAEQNYPESFRISTLEQDNTSKVFNEEGYPREFLSYRSPTENKWILFHSNPTENGDLYYTRIDTLGNQYTDEYNGSHDSITRSIFTENRSLAEQLPKIDALAQYNMNSKEEYGDYYKGVSKYDELGIKEGEGKEALDNALSSIIEHKDLPEMLRSVAKFLLDVPISSMELDSNYLIVGKFKPRIVFTNDPKVAGSSEYGGEIALNTSEPKSKARAAEVLLHEMIHQRLQSTISVSGYDDSFNERLEHSRFKDDWFKRFRDFQEKNPETVQHLGELDRIRFEMRQRLIREMGENAILEAQEKFKNGTPINQKEKLIYATTNLHEFTTHVMTHKGTQEYLNNIPSSTNTSLLGKVWKSFIDILSSISKGMNKWVNKNSQLREALYHTIALITKDEKGSGNITDSIVNNTPLRTLSEQEAESIKDISKDTYGKDVNIENDVTGFNLIMSHKSLRVTSDNNPIGKLASRLKEQMESAYNDISKGNEDDRLQARVRYNELRNDYYDLLREKSNSMIGAIAKKQLDWVDKVLKNKNVNAATTQAAIDTANLWSSMNEIMHSDMRTVPPVDATLAQLQLNASNKRIELINRNAVKVVTEAFDKRIPLTPSDFKTDLKEVPSSESGFLTIARVKPKLVSGIGMLIKEGADNRDEHMQRIHNQLTDLGKRMAKANITPDHFLQKDTWGLKDRLSGKWHDYVTKIGEDRDNALESVIKAEKLPENVRKDRKNVIWQNYYNKLRSSAVFVDSRVFFDTKDGAKLDNDKTTTAYNDLVDKVGSKDYADELIDEAHQKFQKYIKERGMQSDYLDSNIQLGDEEKKGKTLDEQEVLRKEKVSGELNKWLQWNSPHEFLNKMTGKGSLKYMNDGDRWLVMAPKADQTSFYDQEYNKLMSNKAIEPLFTEYKNLIQEMTSYLPPEHSEKLPKSFFPIMSPETVNSLSTMIGKLRNFDSTLLEAFTATDREAFGKIREDEIPIKYIRETKATEDESNRSKDLIRVAEVFSQMALHYRYMAPILDQVNVAESIVKEANRQRVAGEQEGPVLRNALDLIKYNKDKMIFNKPVELEGKVNKAIHSLNPAKAMRIQNDIKELNEQKKALQQEILKREDEGEWDSTEQVEKISKIDEKLEEYDKNARYIYGSKAADVLLSVNQFKTVAYNPFSVIPVFTFNSISAMTYASGRTNYDPTHLRQATGIATHAMKNYYTFGAAMDGTAKKIRNLMERSQVMTQLTGLEHKATRDESHLKEAINPYNWHKAGDYFNKSKVMIAMMLKKEVEVTDKGTGEKSNVRLWDALNQEGKWDTDKYMDNPNWYHEDVMQQKEWNKFRDQMRGVVNIVFGNQDKNSPQMAKKSALWRLVGQFRISWFPEGINARFGSERFDPLLGREVKGRYRSFANLGLFTSSIIMARSLLDSLPGIHVDRFKGLTDSKGEAIKDVDMENMRRNFAGLAWTVSITAAMLAIKALYDDGQQGKKKTSDAMYRQLVINMLTRSQENLLMYASPGVLDTITGNIIPATTVITDTIKAMKATGHYLFGDTHKDKHAFDIWMKKITKATPILNNINKTEYLMSRDVGDVQK